jgi:phosphate/sulfate permease
MKYRLSNAITLDEEKLENERLRYVLPNLQLNPNYFMGTLGGIASSFLLILIWLVLSNATGLPASVMILVIGVTIGKSIRISGAGYSYWFGVTAATVTFIAGLVGIVISSLGIIANQQEKLLTEVFSWLTGDDFIEILFENLNAVKILYLVVASFVSYQLALKNDY